MRTRKEILESRIARLERLLKLDKRTCKNEELSDYSRKSLRNLITIMSGIDQSDVSVDLVDGKLLVTCNVEYFAPLEYEVEQISEFEYLVTDSYVGSHEKCSSLKAVARFVANAIDQAAADL